MNGFQAIGTGLLSLDVIIDKQKFEIIAKTAGGSNGNVLSILSFLGWDSYPISYIGTDSASDLIIEDLKMWGVNTKYIIRHPNVKTPIIIENVLDSSNGKDHEFKFKCPICNSRLPRNRVLSTAIFYSIRENLPKSNVFFIDRLSVSGVEMAKLQKKQNAIIIFEPHKISKQRLFKEMLKITDILKYSSESIEKIPFERRSILEIQTLGDTGVNFTYNQGTYVEPYFKTLKAFDIGEAVDSTGAGDWLSAGLIHKIVSSKQKVPFLNEKGIIDAINYGQSLAALNCMFIGSRGMMYHLEFDKIFEYSFAIQKRKDFKLITNNNIKKKYAVKNICTSCNILSH